MASHKPVEVPPLSESLGLPDVFPCEPSCPENLLTPESLSNGYRISYEEFGITDKRELELTLCNEQEQWSASGLAACRKAVLQQLRLVYHSHKAKRKADVLYDQPLGASNISTAILYPQQHAVGEAARQQWSQDLAGSVHLDVVASSVPHGFMRGKLFDMLSDQRVALPRAVWFIQVAYLNRTKPEGWEGGSKLPTRSLQCTEELLAYMEQAAAAVAASTGSEPSTGSSAAYADAESGARGRWQYLLHLTGRLHSSGLLHTPTLVAWLLGKAAGLPLGLQLHLLPLLHLALPDVALSPQLLRQVLDACLKHTALTTEPAVTSRGANQPAGVSVQHQGEQQQQLRRGYAEVAATLLSLAPMTFVLLDQPSLNSLGVLLSGANSSGGPGEQQGEDGWCIARGPALGLLREVEKAQQRLAATVSPRVLRLADAKAMQLLDTHLASCDAAAAHAELWRLLLPPAPSEHDRQQAQHDLVRLVCAWAVARPVAHMAAALGARCQPQGSASEAAGPPQEEDTRRWAMHGGLQAGRTLLALAILRQQAQQGAGQQAAQAQQPAAPGPGHAAAAPQLAAKQQAKEAGGASEGAAVSAGKPLVRDGSFGGPAAAGSTAQQQQTSPALQQAFFGWLDSVAAECCTAAAAGAEGPVLGQAFGSSPQAGGSLVLWLHLRRVQQWAVLLVDSGLLSPSDYLRCLLASGMLAAKQHQQGQGQGQGQGGGCPRSTFHLALLQELHPSLLAMAPTAAAPKSRHSPTPAPGTQLSGVKRKQSEGAEGASEAGTGAAAATAREVEQQGEEERQAAAAYAALRRAVLGVYGTQGGPVAGLPGSRSGGVIAPQGGQPRSRMSPAPASESLQSLSVDTSMAPSGLDDWWGGGGWEAAARAGTPATPTATGQQEEEQGEGVLGGSAAPQQLRRRLAHLLGLQGRDAAGPAAAAAPQPPDMQQQLWRDALDDISASTAWQQRRHLASWLHTAARQHLRASLPAATGASASAPSASAPTLSPCWLLSVLCTLDACGGHREVSDLLCDLLAALLRTVASAAAVSGAAAPLSQRVWAAQDRFWRRTGLPPSLILRLVAAHHQQLAALGRVPRLLRMLTAGLWTLAPAQAQQQQQQQQQQGAARPHDPRQRQQAAPAQQAQAQAQQEVLSCCHAQLAVAGELLARYAGAMAQPGARAASPSIAKDGRAGAGTGGRGPGSHAAASPAPNSGVQQWVADMERQHGAQHWLLDALRRLAAAAAAPRPGEASGSGPGSGAAAASASRGVSVAAGSARPGAPPAPATLAVAEWMAAAAGQQQGQQQAGVGGGGGAAAAAGLLREALQLVRGAASGATGSASELQVWQAAEQLVGWVAASAPTSPAAASSDRSLQERAAAALLAIFQAHQEAASLTPSEPMAAAGLGQQEAAGHPGLLDCLLRAVELLRRRCGQRLPPSFLPAAIVLAAQQLGAGKSGPGVPQLLLVAICQGLVTMEESLHHAPPSLAAALAVDLSTIAGTGAGECWAFSSFQRNLPPQVAAEALLAALPPAAAGTGSGALAPQQQPAVPVSLGIQEACLGNARQLYAFLSKWAAVQCTGGAPQQQAAQLPAYPPREAALCCLMGRRQGTGSGAESDMLGAVLAYAEPAAAPLCWLVVRAMLDEEVFCAALRRGESVRSALAAASQQAASGDSHATASSEAEKDFTSRVLSELAVRPSVSLTLCAVCGEAGQAVGDYLLQQLDWVLQDNDTLLGRQPLSAVLARRGALVTTPAFNTPQSHSASHAATPPEHRADAAAPGPGGSNSGSGGGACSGGFGVEQGFVEAALVCLAASNDARRRSFAHQLVLQLQRLADAVERLAIPSTARPASATHLGAQGGGDKASGAGAGQAQAQRPLSEHSSQHLPGSPGQQYQAASPAAVSPAGAGRAAAGRGPVGFGWRAGAAGGGWGSGARGAQRGKPGSEEVGSVAGVQAGVWLRLGILFPLLPLVYSDPSPDPTTSLRSLLLNAVTRLLGSPYITATPADWSPSDVHSAAATAAAARAGEVLPARLLHVLHALVGSSWASWLQGGRQLRDVAAFDAVRHLGPIIDGLPAPKRLRLAAGAAVPTTHPTLAALPAAIVQGPLTPAVGAGLAEPHLLREVRAPKMAARADPWLLLPGSATGSDAAQQYKQGGGAAGAAQLAPHWLLGAVRVRKRDGSYCSITDP